MRMIIKFKPPPLTAIALCLALIASACAAKEPVTGPTTSRVTTTQAPTTTEPPLDPTVLSVPDCDDASDCAAGFVLAEAFYNLDCTAVKEELVTEQTLGGGDYAGTDVTVNLIQDVDPGRFVAVSLPGGACVEGDEPTSPWSLAFVGELKLSDRSLLCEVGLLSEAQLIENVCVGQLIPIGDSLPAETIAEVDEVMGDFLGSLPNNNVAARELWSGFPAPGNKNVLFSRFVRDFNWIKTRTVRWEVAGPVGTAGAALVLVTDDSDQGAAFVVSPSTDDSPALIQRLPEPSALRFAPKDRSVISAGIRVTFSGVAGAGEVKAFLGGSELPAETVSRSGSTVTVQLPELLPPLVIVTIASGNAELPAVTSSVYFFRP